MSEQTIDKLFTAMRGAKGVPALESTVTAVLAQLTDRGKGSNDLASSIVEDFALTQKILKLANSSMYAPFSKGASSVTSALDIVGADALLHVVLSTASVSANELEADTGLARTLVASELARSACPDRTEEASIAALMYDLGNLLTTKYLPQEAAAIDHKVAQKTAPAKAEFDVLGMTLQEVGAEVAKKWKLPASIVSIINGTGDPTLVGVAKFSCEASSLIQAGKVVDLARLVEALDVPNIDKSKISGLVTRKLAKSGPAQKAAPADAAELALAELFKTLSSTQWKTVEELAAPMFTGIGHTLKTARCLLFMLTRTGDFAIRYASGNNVTTVTSKLRLSSQYQPTTFHAVIKNNVDVSIADVSKLKATALPDGFSELLPNVNKFIVLPIASSRVTGLVYCDWESDDAISQTELAEVKKLRNLFLPFFPV